MSGHSKWSTIKRKKAVVDAKRGQIFTKIARLITIAVKSGGNDPETNSSLRMALEKAREVNMPRDVIDRAIKKAAGDGGGALFEQFILEGYGPFGVAFLIDCLSDNRNRTVAEVRTLLTRAGGSLGASAYIFQDREKPLFEIEIDQNKADQVIRLVESLDDLEDVQEVYINLKEESNV